MNNTPVHRFGKVTIDDCRVLNCSLSLASVSARDLRTVVSGDEPMKLVLRPSLFGFVVATRAGLAFGVGLLVAGRIPEPRRRTIALALIGVGAATTCPAVRGVLGSRTETRRLHEVVGI